MAIGDLRSWVEVLRHTDGGQVSTALRCAQDDSGRWALVRMKGVHPVGAGIFGFGGRLRRITAR
jgi:hypothetical protein